MELSELLKIMRVHFFRSRWRALTVLSVVCLVLVVFSRLVPDVSEIIEINRQIADNESRIHQAFEIEENIEKIRRKTEHLRGQLKDVVLSQDEDTQLSTIIRKISEAANQEKVTIERIKPGEIRKNQTHTELPIELVISSKYHPMGRFLSRIESISPVIKVEAVSIQSESIISNNLRSEIQVRVFYLEEKA